MKVKFLFSLCLYAFALTVAAQTAEKCGTDQLMHNFWTNDPQAAQKFEQNRQLIENYIESNASRDDRNVIVTIPVVFHVIHSGQAIGTGLNITLDQINSQIDVLNECYRMRNPDTAAIPAWFKDRKADVMVEFCLAQFDTAGNVTTGVTRHNISNTSNFDTNIKPATQWDPSKYLNIWTTNLGTTLLGYATPPGLFPWNQDGVVLDYRHVGKAPANPYTSTHDDGRTCVHEVGHWLNLFHVFQDSCVGTTPQTCKFMGDFICDTPPAKEATFGQPNLLQNTCTETPVDERDMWMNYMDYADDDQLHLFTHDQAEVMRATLATSRLSLQSSMGCTNAFNIFTYSGKVTDAQTSNGVSGAKVLFDGQTDFETTTDANGNFTINGLQAGKYDVYAGKWGYMTNQYTVNTEFNSGTATITIPLENHHYYDDFLFDFSWTKSSTSSGGYWTRAIPVGTFYQSEPANPELDVTYDYGLNCYMTGNGGGTGNTDDVDNGTVTLISPSFDLSTFSDPYIRYSRWFYDGSQSGNTPDDNMVFKINTGSGTVTLETITAAMYPTNDWKVTTIRLNDVLTPGSNMRLIVDVNDLTAGNPNIVEGALDRFEIKDGMFTGIKEAGENNMLVTLYPNPTKGILNVNYTLTGQENLTLTVRTILGQPVISKQLSNAQQGSIQVDVSNQPAGVYVITLQSQHSEKTLKFTLLN